MNPDTSHPPTKRKFLPDLVETTSRSSSSPLKPQAKNEPGIEQQNPPSSLPNPNPATSSPSDETPPKRAVRFSPQVVETSMKEHRSKNGKKSAEATAEARHQDAQQQSASRKFSPQLIETGKRSFRQGNAGYPGQHFGHVKPADKNELPFTPGVESRYSYASLLRRQQAKEGGRRHSFRVPELPAIPCSSSDESARSPQDSSSASTSPTALSSGASRKQSSKLASAEASNDQYSGNLLSDLAAARSVRRLLRDQALAAFPNEQVHQPVSHFAIDREDDETTEEDDDDAMLDSQIDLYTFRRGSTVDLGWELEEMRRHKEDAELRERDRRFAAGHSKFSAASLAAKRMMNNIDENPAHPHGAVGGWQNDVNLAQMKRPVSPPMLGDDIVFAKCLSPQSTFCENDPDAAAAQEDAEAKREPCLWQADHHTDNKFDGGLWHGCCIRPAQPSKGQENGSQLTPAPNPRLGIITPGVHSRGTPLSVRSKPIEEPVSQLPSRPSDGKTPQLKDMQKSLAQEEEIQHEFHDGFVTQIYNYLSLGYPCLARHFDEELSKISHISVEDLRKDDQNTDAKGYVGPAKGNAAPSAKCMRWSALKSYIHEWARQQPRMRGPDDSLDAWGAGARRGSWGN